MKRLISRTCIQTISKPYARSSLTYKHCGMLKMPTAPCIRNKNHLLKNLSVKPQKVVKEKLMNESQQWRRRLGLLSLFIAYLLQFPPPHCNVYLWLTKSFTIWILTCIWDYLMKMKSASQELSFKRKITERTAFVVTTWRLVLNLWCTKRFTFWIPTCTQEYSLKLIAFESRIVV